MHKLKYTMKGGAIFVGFDKYDIVQAIAESSFAPCATTEIWMMECANRIAVQFGYRLDYYNADTFIDELLKYELLQEIK